MTNEKAARLLDCFFRESDNWCQNTECENANPECRIEREEAIEKALAALRSMPEAGEGGEAE